MNKHEKKFIETVWEYYEREGRHKLPWRRTKNPYRILISEIMLQQTQVERVILKYKHFLETFPSFDVLAHASLGAVLRAWQGLGYNRRAKMLHECAQIITKSFRGLTPKSYEELILLPGVGPYTAGAILVFAHNRAVPMIETNIRSVYLHHFFRGKDTVHDTEILRLIERTLDHDNPREWYYALMDYGSFLKKTIGNPNVQSTHYTKQSSFKGSSREVRGAIIACLAEKPRTLRSLTELLERFEKWDIARQLASLKGEGLIALQGRTYRLPE